VRQAALETPRLAWARSFIVSSRAPLLQLRCCDADTLRNPAWHMLCPLRKSSKEAAAAHLDVGRRADEYAVDLTVEGQLAGRLLLPAARVQVVQVRLLAQPRHVRLCRSEPQAGRLGGHVWQTADACWPEAQKGTSWSAWPRVRFTATVCSCCPAKSMLEAFPETGAEPCPKPEAAHAPAMNSAHRRDVADAEVGVQRHGEGQLVTAGVDHLHLLLQLCVSHCDLCRTCWETCWEVLEYYTKPTEPALLLLLLCPGACWGLALLGASELHPGRKRCASTGMTLCTIHLPPGAKQRCATCP